MSHCLRPLHSLIRCSTVTQQLTFAPRSSHCLNYSSQTLSMFVPNHEPVCDEDVDRLNKFLRLSEKIFVLTGAGISTESGIPDYRSEGVGLYARSNHRPVQYQDFVRRADIRKRYWARNYAGWPRFSAVEPNPTHIAVRDLELKHKKVQCLVTQNVDSLHYKAGSKNVIELHGTAFTVMCLGCDNKIDRHDFQSVLSSYNPTMKRDTDVIRPDGDVELTQEQMDGFTVPDCEQCGGILKPNIVFFGDNVPMSRIDTIRQNISASDSLLVLGSSLSVFSGYRILLQAFDLFKTIAIINIGETRGDKHADLKISKRCGEVLPRACIDL